MATLDPIKQRYSDLVTFFQDWIPTYAPNANLFLIGQNGPKPDNPLIAFSPISTIDFVGQDERRVVQGQEVLFCHRKITCELFGFSDSDSRFDGDENAWDMLQALRTSLSFPEVVEKINGIGCSIVDEGVVQNISETLSTTNEPRAVLQFVLSTLIIQNIDSGQISTIAGIGEYSSPANQYNSGYSVSI